MWGHQSAPRMDHPNGIERAPTGQKLSIFCHIRGSEANRATSQSCHSTVTHCKPCRTRTVAPTEPLTCSSPVAEHPTTQDDERGMGDGRDVATWIGVEDEQIGCGTNPQTGSRLVAREPAASSPGRCPQAEEGISPVSYTHLTLPTNREV